MHTTESTYTYVYTQGYMYIALALQQEAFIQQMVAIVDIYMYSSSTAAMAMCEGGVSATVNIHCQLQYTLSTVANEVGPIIQIAAMVTCEGGDGTLWD